MIVIDEQGAARKIHVAVSQGANAGRRRLYFRAGGRGNVQPPVRVARFAIENALAAVNAGNPAGQRPAEACGPVGARIASFSGLAGPVAALADAPPILLAHGSAVLRQA